jgi:hypothetical protein
MERDGGERAGYGEYGRFHHQPSSSGEDMCGVEVRGLPSVGELRWHSQAQTMRRRRPRRADRADYSGRRMLKSRPPSLVDQQILQRRETAPCQSDGGTPQGASLYLADKVYAHARKLHDSGNGMASVGRERPTIGWTSSHTRRHGHNRRPHVGTDRHINPKSAAFTAASAPPWNHSLTRIPTCLSTALTSDVFCHRCTSAGHLGTPGRSSPAVRRG